jgi:hypothetical protein
MTLEQVAIAYAVGINAVYKQLKRHENEIREGVERGGQFVHTLGGPQKMTILYRDGVIKLGFFIRSVRAAAFRQFATKLIVNVLDRAGVVGPEEFTKFATNMEHRFDVMREEVKEVKSICGGLRREVDELKDMLAILWSEREMDDIQREINLTKAHLHMDGRAVVGKVRATLNVSKIYTEALSRQVINTLKNLRGEGLKVIQPEPEMEDQPCTTKYS